MKKPFKVGDRIRVYNGLNKYEGVIADIESSGLIFVCRDLLCSFAGPFQPKQCRRLKPKPVKREPREIWMNEYPVGGSVDTGPHVHPTKEAADALAAPSRIGCIRFREVLDET
jgi:hypothetical protein